MKNFRSVFALLLVSSALYAGTVTAQVADSSAAAAAKAAVEAASKAALNPAPASTISVLLAKSGLDTVFAKGGEFTVFAPTNEAFAASAVKADSLSAADLQKLLLAHVVKSSLLSSAIVKDTALVSEAGTPVAIAKTAAGITVNGAAVVAADVKANNLTIHSVSAVFALPVPAPAVVAAPAPEKAAEPVVETKTDKKAKKAKKAKKTADR